MLVAWGAFAKGLHVAWTPFIGRYRETLLWAADKLRWRKAKEPTIFGEGWLMITVMWSFVSRGKGNVVPRTAGQ